MPNTDQPSAGNWLHLAWATRAEAVVIDANTGRSRGYGFIRFGDDNERSQAMTEMNGVYCLSRPMRIGAATPRKSSGYLRHYFSQGGYSSSTPTQGSPRDVDSTNTTIFVGGLDPNVSDEDLRLPFAQYGEIASLKIDAEKALQKLNGTAIGKHTCYGISQSRTNFMNQWTGPYYGGHFYNAYRYAFPPPHDPGMYEAAAYGAYPVYGTHQQQPVILSINEKDHLSGIPLKSSEE
ncbi:hypothetical protein HAX54_032362 [Datura stramonium]|uniref:RRM domain-containing protein n=1 Tax=Datura stramonium TaxID=4076 RepID=A0ABS8VDR6_DATST|nr:hypothetical protein [Datura stramonium]